MIGNKLFRKEAMAKMTSPEQLDALMPLSAPAGWLAALGLLVLIGALTLWFVFGSILQTATGSGLIVRNADLGIMVVSGEGVGQIEAVLVEPGQILEADQPVVRLDVSLLTQNLDANKRQLASLVEQNTRQATEEAERISILQSRLANQESLFQRGLLTQNAPLETRNAIYELRARAEDREQQILEQKTRIREIEIRLEREAVVRAHHPGRVTEILVDVGDLVSAGRPLVHAESPSGPYQVLCYVPAEKGKKIDLGASIRISPSTVRPEEFGYILGRVTRVSSHSVTREKVLAEFENPKLVDAMFAQGAVTEIEANLERDPSTPSGFRWSSSSGPDLTIESGTLCSASIVLDRNPPLRLLIPFVRKQLGLF